MTVQQHNPQAFDTVEDVEKASYGVFLNARAPGLPTLFPSLRKGKEDNRKGTLYDLEIPTKTLHKTDRDIGCPSVDSPLARLDTHAGELPNIR
jgi:hypothetical protein